MDQPKPYDIAGYPVTCAHCQHREFFTGRVRLESARPLLDPDWPAIAAASYTCARCGHLMWFRDLPPGDENAALSGSITETLIEGEEPLPVENPLSESSGSEPIQCLSCGEMIPARESECPACHWSYQP